MTSAEGSKGGRKVVIVTGGSRGIGREVSLSLAANGWSVVTMFAGNEKAADVLVAEIYENWGAGKAMAVKGDVSVAADVKNAFDRAEEAFGHVNAVVNLAGTIASHLPKLADTTEEEWDRIFTVNTKGTFLVCKEAEKRLVSGGRILTCSTSLAVILNPGYSAYVASKAAVEALTKILAKELRGKNITANCISPGPIAGEFLFAGKSPEQISALTNMAPLERLGQPQDIAGVVKFLLSDDAAWVNGQILRVNGGSGIA
ncbi:3-oxoacyl-[acyl-carrier protein] reductase [Marchantia polymorpha subsp. ruderalis]|nr:hypothetical protein MARPO_0073s0047 [Marchantia polymorpha]BBN12304.1 hypothetical protein Mp_5g18960 [Marchantia polymorpha subsp. ruderalis]|eukprot:PTQ35173.1 hypothetical protein MARPO_0073s0047 [Marchantia polymorpha]